LASRGGSDAPASLAGPGPRIAAIPAGAGFSLINHGKPEVMMCRFILTTMLLAALLGCGGDRADKYTQEGFVFFQQQKYDEAIASYEKAIKLEPRAAAAYNMLGMAYRFKYNQLGVPELRQKEMAAFQKAVEIDPKNWVAMINLATDYYADGDKGKAAALFKKALVLKPDHPDKAKLEKMIAAGEPKP
jgi:tetratricopeptide (TPR) repeat protein